jgi:hypothetical protein
VSRCVKVSNLAPTERAASIVTAHGPVPLQLPDHPANIELPSGAAVRVTRVAGAVRGTRAEHARPAHVSAIGLAATVPAPVPDTTTSSRRWRASNRATTRRTVSALTVHAPVPEHGIDHPANTESAAATAVSVTRVAGRVFAIGTLQLFCELAHENVGAALVTVPLPSPTTSTITGHVVGSNRATTSWS